MQELSQDFRAVFDRSLFQLQSEVQLACDTEAPWPRRVAGAVVAAFAYFVRDPNAARILTLEPGRNLSHGPETADRLTATFARQLRELSGDLSASQGFTEQALIGGLVSLVRHRVTLGDLEALPDLAGGAAQFVLIPYLGSERARRIVAEQVI